MNLALAQGLTAFWIALALFGLLPLYFRPLARIKRLLAVCLIGIGTFFLSVAWMSGGIFLISIYLLALLFVVVSTVMTYYLGKLDYYTEEVLSEAFIVTVLLAVIGISSSLWQWGLHSGLLNITLLRITLVALPVVAMVWCAYWFQKNFLYWVVITFIVLMAVKWMTLPFWGIWTSVIVLLYSVLTGNVLAWMASTTYAEKILAWNISPSKVWGLLVASAGILILFF
ncbi:MAG: hypothetical protein QY312_03650 [Candidatus Dojkabacteria bacterium]|nr:MAG: hypothetical protein QY312_03650 [Candidatus Dojkabacteria bacterium]